MAYKVEKLTDEQCRILNELFIATHNIMREKNLTGLVDLHEFHRFVFDQLDLQGFEID